jgi:hypothetical protein
MNAVGEGNRFMAEELAEQKRIPRGLKPARDDKNKRRIGTAEAVPFQNTEQKKFFCGLGRRALSKQPALATFSSAYEAVATKKTVEPKSWATCEEVAFRTTLLMRPGSGR